jgi:hypothetical protein
MMNTDEESLVLGIFENSLTSADDEVLRPGVIGVLLTLEIVEMRLVAVVEDMTRTYIDMETESKASWDEL